MGKLSIGLRVQHQDPRHTHFDVFTGLDGRNRGNAGRLIFRTDEFRAFVRELRGAAATAPWAFDVEVLEQSVSDQPSGHCMRCGSTLLDADGTCPTCGTMEWVALDELNNTGE